ncbi:hypothetical protein AB1N83_014219 [Pleurotus pulmonarius]
MWGGAEPERSWPCTALLAGRAEMIGGDEGGSGDLGRRLRRLGPPHRLAPHVLPRLPLASSLALLVTVSVGGEDTRALCLCARYGALCDWGTAASWRGLRIAMGGEVGNGLRCAVGGAVARGRGGFA